MGRPPAFQFYPADFLSDEKVVLMSLEQIGIYVKLLCFCWREGSIPSDVSVLARLVGCDGSAMISHWLKLSSCFVECDGRLIHPRLERELSKQLEYHEERSEAGKKGAKHRWLKKMRKHGSAIAEPSAQPMAKNASSSSSSSSINTPIVPKGTSTYAACFNEWWNVYPNQTGKAAAYRAYKRAGKALVDNGMTKEAAREFLLSRAAAFADSPKGKSEFVPNPSTWLNQGRYDDNPAAWQRVDTLPLNTPDPEEADRARRYAN